VCDCNLKAKTFIKGVEGKPWLAHSKKMSRSLSEVRMVPEPSEGCFLQHSVANKTKV
jgi:hypothetical protein